MGFKNKFIVKQLIANITFFPIFYRVDKLDIVVSSIGNLDENRLYNVEIYSESIYINKITGSNLDEVWNQVAFLKKYTRSYLFGITNTLVQEHLNTANSESPTCTVKE
ncbi:7122_t:CDS:2 [Gigaspora margarita]|uniref:7122_t:CDS:1 n=1 Tax=Gigaspora margarita TaxID=4874 RepID=A0ABN7WJX9_GIGMA|nr:7122_t:CDS:2 [Gigaspora margarita]